MQVASHQASFSSQPLLQLSVAAAAGIWLAHTHLLVPLWSLVCALVCLCAAFLAFAAGKELLTTLCVLAASAGAGATLALIEQVEPRGDGAERVQRLYDTGRIESGAPLEVTGVLLGAPELAPDGFYLSLQVERLRLRLAELSATGALELFAPIRDEPTRRAYQALELRRGARLRLLVRLERDEQFRNPGASSLNEWLARRGFDAVGTIKSPLLVERLDDERVLLPLVWLDAWRARLRARFTQLFSTETAGVLQAALLGNRYGLSRPTAERFRAGGTFHVLVINGLHVSFIGWLALLLLRRVTKRRALQFIVVCALLWLYAVAVGASLSVVRATLMFTLVALAPLVGRRAATLNALGGAALLLLVWRARDLFDPSFQLTFASVFGIVALGWPLLARLQAVGAWRPTRQTPRPPACPRWFRLLGELLFWRERRWRAELARTGYDYRLFKSRAAGKLDRWRVQWLVRYAASAIVISASVQLCLLPLLVIYFHRLTPVALLLNIFVGALMAALGLTALAAVLLATFNLKLAHPFIWLSERLNWLMTHSVDPFTRAHVAAVRLPAYHDQAASIYVCYYLLLVGLLFALARWQPLARERTPARRAQTRALTCAGLTCAALCCIIILHPLSAPGPDGRLRIDFLDVGQGDAALVTLPDGTTLLVDAGGRPIINRRRRTSGAQLPADTTASHDSVLTANDSESAVDDPTAEAEATPADFKRDARSIGDAVVSEYLWWRGLDRVDYMLATHAHADHIDGLNDVAENFAVRAAFVARTPQEVEEYARLTATLRAAQVPVYLLGRGAQLRFGAVTADVLWPPPDSSPSAPSGNDDSIVLRLRYGARTILLTGDIESHAEAELLRAQDDLHCDVVKVAHHGSGTSSTESFVAATRPQVAIISVGRTSPFGHPDKNVIARWQANGAQVLVTGWRGTITVSTDGRDLRVETYGHD